MEGNFAKIGLYKNQEALEYSFQGSELNSSYVRGHHMCGDFLKAFKQGISNMIRSRLYFK